MPDEKFEKWLRDQMENSKDMPSFFDCWTAALASRSTTPGKLEELIDGLVGKLRSDAAKGKAKAVKVGRCSDVPLQMLTEYDTALEHAADAVAALKPALREAVDAEVAAAYAKGAADMREVVKLHVETHSYVRQRDLIEAVDALPIPAAPQPRDLGKLWELQKRWDAKFETIDGDMLYGFCADELADILKEMEGK